MCIVVANVLAMASSSGRIRLSSGRVMLWILLLSSRSSCLVCVGPVGSLHQGLCCVKSVTSFYHDFLVNSLRFDGIRLCSLTKSEISF